MKKIVIELFLITLLIGTFSVAFNVQGVDAWTGGTIVINADGSITPPDAPISTADNITYIFTGDVISDGTGDGLNVLRDNIVIDGAGYTLQGQGWPQKGIRFSGRRNVTIKNLNINGWLFGIAVSGTSLVISGNNMTDISRVGIGILGSKNIVSRNNIIGAPGDSYGIQHYGDSNSIVYENNISRFWYGICLTYSASNHTIYKNTIRDNTCGIGTREPGANHNKIYENEIINNPTGIVLGYSANYNNVTKNHITSSRYKAIHIRESSNNTIFGNDIVSNGGNAILLQSASYTSIIQNNIINNGVGIYQESSSNNTVYHNSFINNTNQVYDLHWDYPSVAHSINVWDDGYPSGGNYWSDYNGTDFYSGPNQNEPGSDGIGDTPYIIDIKNQDHYPLVAPYWESFPYCDWPMLQHNAQKTGYSRSKIPNNLSLHWSFSSPGEYYVGAPVVFDGKVFIGSWQGNLWALNETTGNALWSFPVGPVRNSPAIDGERIFVGTETGKLYCFDLEGNLLWNFTTEYNPWIDAPAPIWSSPVVDSQKVCFLTYGGFFYALNISDGEVVWDGHPTATWTLEMSSAAIYKDIVYFGSIDSWIYALNASSGHLIWRFNTDGSITSSPTVTEGKLYLGSSDNKFYCLNATDGTVIWNFTAEGPIYSPSAFINDRIYFSCRWPGQFGEGGKLYALEASTGTPIWNVTFERRVRSGPIIADGKIFVGMPNPVSGESVVYSLNLTDGTIIWSFRTNSSAISCPSLAVANNKLFVGSDRVYAFGAPLHPVANFTWAPQTPKVGDLVIFNASLSVPNGGIIAGYEWDFGDGENATGEVVTHTYFAAGNYTVTLNVTDTEGLWNVEEKMIEVKPLPSFILTIETSVGGTTDPAPGTYSYTVNSTAEVTAIPEVGYLFDYWELDNVNAGSANPYTVLMDQNHTLKAFFRAIPPPLSVSINPLSASILIGETVTFTSTVSGGYPPYSYQWYLNGTAVSGATSEAWNFTPLTAGVYNVYLNVTDDSGNVAISDTAAIFVAPQLIVSISPMSMSVLAGEPITFTSTTTGGYPPYSYQWYFNDNPVSGATSNTWTFTPSESGIYYVHLKVTDSEGNTAQSETARIVVSAVPVGGYSIPVKVHTKMEPIIPYIALITMLTAIFISLKRKTKRKC